MMSEIVGIEGDAVLAEEIRAGYAAVPAHLREVIEILKDETKTTVMMSDPVHGMEHPVKCYARKLTGQQEAWFCMANWWHPGEAVSYLVQRRRELESTGKPFSYRQPTVDLYTETLNALEMALATETSAEYWIRRWPHEEPNEWQAL